jgi:predicted nucleic acid-binding protein
MIVFDASTLILLAKIDMLDVFVSNFPGRVLIPEKVQSEACIKGREETLIIKTLIGDGTIAVVKIKDRKQREKIMDDFSIDQGEADALLLALQEKAVFIATDDRNAIRACKALKIDFITAIAVLVRAFEKGLIEKDETLAKLTKLESIARYRSVIIEDARQRIEGGK